MWNPIGVVEESRKSSSLTENIINSYIRVTIHLQGHAAKLRHELLRVASFICFHFLPSNHPLLTGLHETKLRSPTINMPLPNFFILQQLRWCIFQRPHQINLARDLRDKKHNSFDEWTTGLPSHRCKLANLLDYFPAIGPNQFGSRRLWKKKKRTQQSNLDEQDTWRQRYDSRKNSRHLISSEQGDSAE